MTIEQVRKAHQAKPFKPFTLRTGDGREYLVRHPEFLWIPPPGRVIAVADLDGSVDMIDLLLVTSLHFENGRSRKPHGRRAS